MSKKIEYDTSDWPLYRSRELVRVGMMEDGSFLMQDEKGKVTKLSEEKLNSAYEPVKGLVKGA